MGRNGTGQVSTRVTRDNTTLTSVGKLSGVRRVPGAERVEKAALGDTPTVYTQPTSLQKTSAKQLDHLDPVSHEWIDEPAERKV